ncbi:biotin [Sesbania bispinosa]|nr:biotin [Sesbania bispinosa]
MAAVMAVMAVSHGGGWRAWWSWHPFWAFFSFFPGLGPSRPGSPTLWRGQVPLCSSVGTLKRGEHRTLKRGSD